MIAGEREAVGRHPVIGEGEGRRQVGGARTGHAVDTGLEGVALAAAETVRQAPIGAAAGECHTHDGVGRDAIVEAAGKSRGARGEIVAAEHRRIA